jgi:N-acetylmuramoyl-L-alanine amidase
MAQPHCRRNRVIFLEPDFSGPGQAENHRANGLLTITKSVAFGVACLLAAHVAADPARAIEGRNPTDETTSTASHPRGATCAKAASLKIVLDVGHTPEAKGAISARGMPEYDFNVALVKKLEDTLRAGGYANLFPLFTNGTGRAQLMQRTARANELMPDLFMSFHHDDVQPVYYAKWTYRGHRYHYSDVFSGFSVFVSRKNKYFDDSLALAAQLGGELASRGLKPTAHHAEKIPGEGRELIDKENGVYNFDDLFVLKNVQAPAMLLESGVIVNREDELVLRKDKRRELVSSAVLAAVDGFCARRK